MAIRSQGWFYAVIAMMAIAGGACAGDGGDGEGGDMSSRSQAHIRALGGHLLYTLIHEGHDGLTDEHLAFMDELAMAHEGLSDDHKEVIADFHDTELVPRGYDPAHFLHDLYYNPNLPEIVAIMTNPQLLQVERALHHELGVPFDENFLASTSALTREDGVLVHTQALLTCTVITAVIIGIVAGVVAAGIVAGTIITLAVIDSNGAVDFCDKCSTSAGMNCKKGTSSYTCDTAGTAATDSSGMSDKESDTYKSHDSNHTNWTCTYQCIK